MFKWVATGTIRSIITIDSNYTVQWWTLLGKKRLKYGWKPLSCKKYLYNCVFFGKKNEIGDNVLLNFFSITCTVHSKTKTVCATKPFKESHSNSGEQIETTFVSLEKHSFCHYILIHCTSVENSTHILNVPMTMAVFWVLFYFIDFTIDMWTWHYGFVIQIMQNSWFRGGKGYTN